MSVTLALALVVLAAVTGLVLLFFYPEVAFALFLYSYVLEGGDTLPEYYDLTLVTLIVATLGFLFWFSKKKRAFHFQLTPPDILLTIVAAVVFLAVLWSPAPSDGLLKATRFAVLSVSPYFIARVFLTDKRQLFRFLYTLLAFATATAVLLFSNLLALPTGDVRLQLLEANQIPVGVLLAVGFIIAAITGLEQSKRRPIPTIVLGGIGLSCLVGIASLGVRGPFVASMVGIATYFSMRMWLSKGSIKPIARSLAALSLTLVGIAAITRLVLTRLPMFERYYTLTAVLEGMATQERLRSYEAAIGLFLEQPVLGIGTAGFSHFTAWSYPHNIFLETAVETGIVGLLIFIAFLAAVAFRAARALSRQGTSGGDYHVLTFIIIAVAVALLAERQVSFGLASNKDLFAFLGLAIGLTGIDRARGVPGKAQGIPSQSARHLGASGRI